MQGCCVVVTPLISMITGDARNVLNSANFGETEFRKRPSSLPRMQERTKSLIETEGICVSMNF